jgi:hypothetical protein
MLEVKIGHLCLENENARYYASSPPFRLKTHCIGRLSLVKDPIALVIECQIFKFTKRATIEHMKLMLGYLERFHKVIHKNVLALCATL